MVSFIVLLHCVRKIIGNIAVVFLLLVFIAGSSGIFMYKHYCHRSGHTEVHIISDHEAACCPEEFGCHCNTSAEGEHSGCVKEQDATHAAENVPVVSGQNCCDNDPLFFKISSDFLKQNQRLEPIPVLALFNVVIQPVLAATWRSLSGNQPGPPPGWGRPIFIFQGALLI